MKVEFKENPAKTRHGGLRNPARHSPQQLWSTDGGERDPVRSLEKLWTAVFDNNTTSNDSHLVFQDPNGRALHWKNNEVCGQLC